MLVISGGYPGYPRPPPYLPMAGPVYWPGPGYPSPPISPPGGGSYYLPGPLLSTPASSLSSLSTVAVSPGPPHPASPPPPASQQHNTLVYISLVAIFISLDIIHLCPCYVAADGGDREPAGQVCAGRDAGAGSRHRPASGQVIRLHPLAAAHLRICTIIIIIYYYYYHLPCIILPISQATPYIANITEFLDKTSMKLYFPNLIYL